MAASEILNIEAQEEVIKFKSVEDRREFLRKILETNKKNSVKFAENMSFLETIPFELFRFRDFKDNWSRMVSEKSLSRDNFEVPEKDHVFKELTTDQVKQILGKKWRTMLKNILYVVEYEQYCVPRDYQVVVPLATTSQVYLSAFKSGRMSSYVFAACQRIELMYCYNPTFVWWGKELGGVNICKRFIFNRKMMDLVKQMCKDEGIVAEKCTIKNYVDYSKISISGVAKSEFNKVDFGSNLRINNSVTDTQINKILYKKYPGLEIYQKKIDELNEKLPSEQQIKFIVHITRSQKFITKIGIRATNSVVSLKDRDEEGEELPNHKTTRRTEYLNSALGNYFNKYTKTYSQHSYDVHSSIYRVQKLMNTGVWEDNNVDLYDQMYGEKIVKKNERDGFKYYCMYAYFNKSKDSMFSKIRSRIPVSIETYGQDYIKKDIAKRKKKMEVVLGGSLLGSPIFLHESCIYLDVFSKLIDKGYKVVQIYDGFYSDSILDPAEMDKLVKECAEEYYKNYKNGFNNSVDLKI